MADFGPWLTNVREEHRELASNLIELVRQAGPKFDEAIKWGNPCFAVDGALRCYVADYPKHVHLGLYNGASINVNGDLIEGTGKRLRHVKLTELTTELKNRLREIVMESASLPASTSR